MQIEYFSKLCEKKRTVGQVEEKKLGRGKGCQPMSYLSSFLYFHFQVPFNYYFLFSINPFPNEPWFLHVCSKCLLEQFLLFPQCFLSFWRTFIKFKSCRLQTFSILKSPKFVILGRVNPSLHRSLLDNHKPGF